MFESGAFVARHVDPIEEAQIQPNGVDLTLGGVAVQRRPGRIGRDGKTIGERATVEPVVPHDPGAADTDAADAVDSGGGAEDEPVPVYRLEQGGYALEYGERVHIPDGHVGFILPRSSLMRNSCMLNTAVWDAGYEGRGEGLLQVHHPIEIEAGARVAQLVLAEADHDGTYDGSYQGERL